MYIKIIITILFTIFVVAFASFNMAPVIISFFGTQMELPLIFLILSSLLVGILLGGVIILVNNVGYTRRIKLLSRKISEQEEDLKAMRKLQIEEKK